MKNLLKFSLLSFFVFYYFSSGMLASAAETPVSKGEVVVLSTVNIKNPKIISQTGSTFNISFTLSNREGLQTDVKYGVKLVKNGRYTADEKIYEDSLTLNPNTEINKNIVYEAPSVLEGEYFLVVVSNNSSGFPFAMKSLGKVTLQATSKGINILPETCFLQVVGEKSSPKYMLMQGVDIKPEEDIKLTCTVSNSSSGSVTYSPKYETRYRSKYGNIVEQIGGDMKPVSFGSNEKKIVSLILPKATAPQSYNTEISFVSGEYSSNSIDAHYVIRGNSATVQKVSLDKDYYKKGEEASVSLYYTLSADSFPGSRYKPEDKTVVTLSMDVSNGKGKPCAKITESDLKDQISPVVTFPVSITSNCFDPKIVVTLTDDKGNILDQKEFNVKTTSKGNNLNIVYYILLLILLIIIIASIYLKKKNNSNTPNFPEGETKESSIPLGILFFFIFSFLSLFSFHKASADSFTVNDYTASVSTSVIFTVDLGGDVVSWNNEVPEYNGGTNIEAQGYMTYGGCGNSIIDNALLSASTNGNIISLINESSWDYRTFSGGDEGFWGSGGLVAPDQAGNSNVTFRGEINGISGEHLMPYIILGEISTPTTKTVDIQVFDISNSNSGPVLIPKNADNITTAPIDPGTPIRLSWDAKGFNSNVICKLPPNNTPTSANTTFGDIDLLTGPTSTTKYYVICNDTPPTPTTPTSPTTVFSNLHYALGVQGTLASTTPIDPYAALSDNPTGVGGKGVLKVNGTTVCDTSDPNFPVGVGGYGYDTLDCGSANWTIKTGDIIQITATGYQTYFGKSYAVKSLKFLDGGVVVYSYIYKVGDPIKQSYSHTANQNITSNVEVQTEFMPI